MRCYTGNGMTQWANKLDTCLQTFHKEALHALNDLKRSPGSQDMHICERLGLNSNVLIPVPALNYCVRRIDVDTFLGILLQLDK